MTVEHYAGGITWLGLDEDEEYIACLIAAGWIDAPWIDAA